MQEIYNGSTRKTLQLTQNPAWFCSHEKQGWKHNSREFCICLSTPKKTTLKYPCRKLWKKPKSPPSTCYGCMDLENFHVFGQYYYPWNGWICFKPAKICLAKPWYHKRSCSGAIIGCSLFLNPLNLAGNEDFGLTHSLCRPPPSPEFQLSPQQTNPAPSANELPASPKSWNNP